VWPVIRESEHDEEPSELGIHVHDERDAWWFPMARAELAADTGRVEEIVLWAYTHAFATNA